MEAFKKVISFGGTQKHEDSGPEPISGEQGEGTVIQPYDAGNLEENTELGGNAPQQTGSIAQNSSHSGQEPISGQQGEGTATQPFDAGNQEDDSELGGKSAQHPISGDVTPTAETTYHTPDSSAGASNNGNATAAPAGTNVPKESPQSAPKLVKNPTIGSSRWFINANPFARPSEPVEVPATVTGAPEQEQQPEMSGSTTPSHSNSALPPNHLGDNVPPGQKAIVHEPVIDSTSASKDYVAAGQSDSFDRSKGKGKGKGRVAPVEEADHRDFSGTTEVSSAESNRSERIRPESIVTDYTYPTAGTDASTIASSSRRSSGVLNIPHSKGAPIMAGGVPLGLRAMQDRERRFTSMPILEHPEQDYNTQLKSETPDAPETQEVPTAGPPSSTLRGSKRYDSVGVGEHAQKQPVTEIPARRMSVMQKARSLGRKVRHSISS